MPDGPQVTAGGEFVSARRGDLLLLGQDGDCWRFGVVTSITREGVVRAARLVGYGDVPTMIYPPRPGQVVKVMCRDRIDVDAALAVAAAHTWPQHDSPMPYSSLTEAREAVRHLIIGGPK